MMVEKRGRNAKILDKKRNLENGTWSQGEPFKNLNYEECCRDRTEKEKEMWGTSPCSHSSASSRT